MAEEEKPDWWYEHGRFTERISTPEELALAFPPLVEPAGKSDFDEFLAFVRANPDRIPDPRVRRMLAVNDIEGLRAFHAKMEAEHGP